MSGNAVVKIGNAQGFWGDWPEAPARLVARAPDLDYLTLDYLAEVSMSILAKQRERDPAAGYARDFLEVITSLAPTWRARRSPKLVTNAGGLNPAGCAKAAAKILRDGGCSGMRIGIVSGDDVLPALRDNPTAFPHLETAQPLSTVLSSLVTANTYVGAAPVIEALSRGADIVVTGRVADPSLTVGPAAHHFGWQPDDYDRLAGATVAGHLIECGAQVTGGISTDWLDIPNPADIGFPIAEIADDGSCVITKPPGAGGRVDQRIVKEQLVYEIGDPENYISPDATVSFLSLRLEDQGVDRVRVSGAIGRPPPKTYKVSATYRAGYRASGMLTIFGRDAVTKARRSGEIILTRLRQAGFEPARSRVECIGAGDVVPGAITTHTAASEVALRVSVYDPRRDVVERFTRELAPLITGGPQGVTGYAEGRPAVREVFGYWPTLIDRSAVRTQVEILEV
jgi:hypothetical protein